MKDQAEEVTNLVELKSHFRSERESDADKAATVLIESYLGPKNKVISMSSFYSALSQSLREARASASAGALLTAV